MPELLTILVSQGPLGILSSIFVWLYLAERKRANETTISNNVELTHLREEHYEKLDAVRRSQIAREQEIAKTLEEYGRGVVEAIDRSAFLAEELRRMSRNVRIDP